MVLTFVRYIYIPTWLEGKFAATCAGMYGCISLLGCSIRVSKRVDIAECVLYLLNYIAT